MSMDRGLYECASGIYMAAESTEIPLTAHPEAVDPAPVTYVLPLPWDRPHAALTGNSRAHWRARSAAVREVRMAVTWLARQARIPVSRHLTVQLVWAPGDRRRRDADNCWPWAKSACDALARGPRRDWVGLELVADDTPNYMTKLTPLIVPPPHEKGMWLHVTAHDPIGETAA